jgi:hypothetical protein
MGNNQKFVEKELSESQKGNVENNIKLLEVYRVSLLQTNFTSLLLLTKRGADVGFHRLN